MVEQSRVQGEKLRDKRCMIEDLQQSQRNLLQELLQLAQSDDEFRGDYEKARRLIQNLQTRAQGHPIVMADPRPPTSTPLMTPPPRSLPLINHAETPIVPIQASRAVAATRDLLRQRHHAEASGDVTLDSRSSSAQDTPPLQTPSSGLRRM